MARLFKLGILISAALGPAGRRGFNDAEKSTARLGEAITNTRKRVERLREQQRVAGYATGELSGEYLRLGRAVEKAGKRLKGFRSELVAAGRLERSRVRWHRARGFAAGALGAAYGAAGVARNVLDEERATVRLRTVLVTDDLDADVAAAREHAAEQIRSGATLHSMTELLEVQYALSSAGFEAEEARLGSAVVSRVATVTSGVPKQVAEVMATVANTLGDSVEGTPEERDARIGDVLTQAQFRFQLDDFGQLGEGMNTVAAAAMTMRLGLEETSAAIGRLNTLGKHGIEAGTALEAVLRQLGPASSKLGFEIRRDAEGGLDLVATLEGLRTALAGYGDDVDARAAAVRDAFGDEGSAVTLLLDNLQLLREDVDALRAADGIVNEKHAYFENADFGRLKIARENFALLGTALTKGAVSVGAGWAELFGSWAVGASKMLETTPLLRTTISYALTSFSTLLGISVATTGIAFAARQVWAVLRRIGMAIRTIWRVTRAATAAQWLYNRAVRGGGPAGPTGHVGSGAASGAKGKAAGKGRMGAALRKVGGVLGAVVGLLSLKVIAIGALIAGAVYLVYRYWDPIRDFFVRLWDGVTGLVGAVVESWKQVFADFSLAKVGRAVMGTLAAGIRMASPLTYQAVEWVLSKLGDLWPGSDAKRGPLSRLTASGAAILRTVGDGVRRAGPDGLRRPLAGELAAASTALALAVPAFGAAAADVRPAVGAAAADAHLAVAAPAVRSASAHRAQGSGDALPPFDARIAAAAVPIAVAAVDVPAPAETPAAAPITPAGEARRPTAGTGGDYHDHRRFYITVQQRPGENAAALAERVLAEIDRRTAAGRRAALYDEG